MTLPLGIWRKPDNRSVRSHQKLADATNRTASVGAAGEMSVGASLHGFAVLDERAERWLDVREGIITNAGPAAEPDRADHSYWVKLAAVDAANSDVAAVPVVSPAGPTTAGGSDEAEPSIVLASNRAEQAAGTHLLPTDETCWVLLIGYLDAGGAKRYLFSQSPPATGIKFGKLAASWPAHADHNLVDLTPCVSASDATTLTDADGNPLPNISAYIQTPLGSTPAFFAVNSGEVVAYFTDTDGNNILIHAPVPGSNALYDVVSITSIVGGKGVGGCGPLRAQ